MRINRKRRNRSEMIERIELSREMTRFRRDDQYFVTLKMRKSLRALKTDRPKEPACIVIHPSTLNTDYLLWHTQLIVCAVKYQIMV